MEMVKKDIRQFSRVGLLEIMTELGEKPYRAKQIYEWIWSKSATSFDEMTNISKSFRSQLKAHFEFLPIRKDIQQTSHDGTVKASFRLFDGNLIEGVLIPSDHRMTACISSQVGCSLSCAFCATGYLERKRNLTPAEIYDQVIQINLMALDIYKLPLTNIVLMGMGEPLLNYPNVMQAIDHLISPEGLGMSSRRITLSTAGIAKMIRKLADDEVRFNLALSLHAATDQKRNQIMPINASNSLQSLSDALQYFYPKTKSKITLEYIAFKNFNDGPEDAEDLYHFAKKIPCLINIIEYNPIDQATFQKSSFETLEKFRASLEKKGLNVRLRRSRGKDIDAACGQLANKRN
jgi:23S rRNA (adenine2503-C2)-methyltransferase